MISLITVKIISIVLVVPGFVCCLYYQASTNSPQRAGKFGTAYTYLTTENSKIAHELVAILREAKQVVPPQLEEMSRYGGGGGRSRFGGGGGGRGGGRGGRGGGGGGYGGGGGGYGGGGGGNRW